jgi:protein involved in polysaccharide export with SLBB domain
VLSKLYRSRVPLLVLQALLLFSAVHSQTEDPTPAPSPDSNPAIIAPAATAAANTPPAPATNDPTPVVETNIAPEDRIHFGDLIEIDVVGSLEYDWQGKVNQEGFLAELAFAAEPVLALCQSEESLAQKIAAAYGKYLRSPLITVKILDRSDRPIATLLGAVKTPAAFRIKRAVRLNELVIRAGGIADNASGEIQIYRPAGLSCESDKSLAGDKAPTGDGTHLIEVNITDLIAGRAEANPVIHTGDVITVKKSAVIYVTGGVTNPRAIFARQEMTLSRAIATAGGTLKGADLKKIVIYRRQNGATSIVDADLIKIESKETPDVVLQAFDVIEVPQTGRELKRQPPVIRTDDPGSVALPLIVVD